MPYRPPLFATALQPQCFVLQQAQCAGDENARAAGKRHDVARSPAPAHTPERNRGRRGREPSRPWITPTKCCIEPAHCRREVHWAYACLAIPTRRNPIRLADEAKGQEDAPCPCRNISLTARLDGGDEEVEGLELLMLGNPHELRANSTRHRTLVDIKHAPLPVTAPARCSLESAPLTNIAAADAFWH